MAKKRSLTQLFQRVLSAVVVAGFAVLVVANAASRFIEDSRPGLAQRLNPLNVEARIGALVSALNKPPETQDVDALERRAKRIIALAPSDARARSLLGAAEKPMFLRLTKCLNRPWPFPKRKYLHCAGNWHLRPLLATGPRLWTSYR